jgi:hypothetical protein
MDRIDRIDRGGSIVRRDYVRLDPHGSRSAPSSWVLPILLSCPNLCALCAFAVQFLFVLCVLRVLGG